MTKVHRPLLIIIENYVFLYKIKIYTDRTWDSLGQIPLY